MDERGGCDCGGEGRVDDRELAVGEGEGGVGERGCGSGSEARAEQQASHGGTVGR